MLKKTNASLQNLIKILNDGDFHDGNTLGLQLKMTRSAIWKLIKKLIHYGIHVDSVKGKGYCLREPLILLQQDQIESHLKNATSQIRIFEKLDSTNDYLKMQKNIKTPLFCFAEFQSKGKGRLNRVWYSPFGKNIYFSCRYPFKKDVSELAGLSLVIGLAVIKVLQKWGLNHKLCVKWPNDVYYEAKKLAGILVEIQAESHDCITHAIIGIGMNVNSSQKDQDHISKPWTSLGQILDGYIDRNKLSADLINHLMEYLLEFEEKGLKFFMDEWMNADCLIHRTITLKSAEEEWQGIVQGINAQGQLLLQLSGGGVRAFSSGEVTVVL